MVKGKQNKGKILKANMLYFKVNRGQNNEKDQNYGLPEPFIYPSKSKNGKYVAAFYYWKLKDYILIKRAMERSRYVKTI